MINSQPLCYSMCQLLIQIITASLKHHLWLLGHHSHICLSQPFWSLLLKSHWLVLRHFSQPLKVRVTQGLDFCFSQFRWLLRISNKLLIFFSPKTLIFSPRQYIVTPSPLSHTWKSSLSPPPLSRHPSVSSSLGLRIGPLLASPHQSPPQSPLLTGL